jgi:NAD+ diphosphatase
VSGASPRRCPVASAFARPYGPPMPEDTLCFAFRGRDLLVVPDGPRARVPDEASFLALGLQPVRRNDLGVSDGQRIVAVELADDAETPAGASIENLRRLFSRLDELSYRRAFRAVQVVAWDRNHQFCSRCATPVERVASELAKRCLRCDLTFYPRLSPAVIVLVERDDTVLLASNARFPGAMYSTLAGFVEAGETLEEAVAREIREEASIEVRAVRYFGSQPWPFPDSLMVAFTAEYAGGDLRPEPSELSDAGWFRVDAMPVVPPRLSIARALIDAWVLRQGGDPGALKTVG